MMDKKIEKAEYDDWKDAYLINGKYYQEVIQESEAIMITDLRMESLLRQSKVDKKTIRQVLKRMGFRLDYKKNERWNVNIYFQGKPYMDILVSKNTLSKLRKIYKLYDRFKVNFNDKKGLGDFIKRIGHFKITYFSYY